MHLQRGMRGVFSGRSRRGYTGLLADARPWGAWLSRDRFLMLDVRAAAVKISIQSRIPFIDIGHIPLVSIYGNSVPLYSTLSTALSIWCANTSLYSSIMCLLSHFDLLLRS